jgi:hypothetical protein
VESRSKMYQYFLKKIIIFLNNISSCPRKKCHLIPNNGGALKNSEPEEAVIQTKANLF